MDLTTLGVKLSKRQYPTAEAFKQDFDLMIQNCNDFNPVGHEVRECGDELRRRFEAWWDDKERWETAQRRELATKNPLLQGDPGDGKMEAEIENIRED